MLCVRPILFFFFGEIALDVYTRLALLKRPSEAGFWIDARGGADVYVCTCGSARAGRMRYLGSLYEYEYGEGRSNRAGRGSD